MNANTTCSENANTTGLAGDSMGQHRGADPQPSQRPRLGDVLTSDLGDKGTGRGQGRWNSVCFWFQKASWPGNTTKTYMRLFSSCCLFWIISLRCPLHYHLEVPQVEKKEMLLAGSWVGRWFAQGILLHLVLPYHLDILDGKWLRISTVFPPDI